MTTNLIFTMLICGAIGASVFGIFDGAAWRISGLGRGRLRLWTFILFINVAVLAVRIKGGYLV